MTHHTETLAALIGSRICHDLISPIGAVNNGLELLALSGAPGGPEMTLVSDSAASASARIRLLRLAFGVASASQATRAEEIVSAWNGSHPERRVTLDWQGPDTMPRPMARLVVLACLCAESALSQGGYLVVSRDEAVWRIAATGPRISAQTELWDCLSGLRAPRDLSPTHVQFLVLPCHLAEEGRLCSHSHSDTELHLSF